MLPNNKNNFQSTKKFITLQCLTQHQRKKTTINTYTIVLIQKRKYILNFNKQLAVFVFEYLIVSNSATTEIRKRKLSEMRK